VLPFATSCRQGIKAKAMMVKAILMMSCYCT